MSEFKVGDKVIRTGQSSHGVVDGNRYTVRKVEEEGDWLFFEGVSGVWSARNFTLAEEPFGKNLFGHKIHLEDELQSRLVQLEIFKAGGRWLWPAAAIECEGISYLFVGKDGRMTCTIDQSSFNSHYFPEIKLKTVTSLEIISVEDDSDKKELQKTIDELKSALDNAQQKLDTMK